MTTPPVTLDDLGTVLSIWAHPDDETYLAGGVMAAAVDRGHRVVCVSATAGERGTPDPGTWPPERLERVRRWEAAAAMAVLGVGEHRMLGLPDGDLVSHRRAGADRVRDLLDELRPDTILTFGPDGVTFHPDHIEVHRWVTDAWLGSGCRGRLLYASATDEYMARVGPMYEEWGVYMTDARPTGVPADRAALHLRLEGAALDRKLTALAAMASQTGPLLASVDLVTYTSAIAEETFVAAPRE